VVDDDPDMREAISMILRPVGFQIITAKDGEEALLKLAAEKPNLMLLDLVMPRQDGFAVLKELYEEEKWRAYDNMPIVVLSAVREEPARRRYEQETAAKFAVDYYVEKPVSPATLLQKVSAVLARTSTARQRS
jgi:CheY-like chemotaxis protein